MASWKEYLFTKRKFSWGKKIYLRETTFFKSLGHGNVRDSARHPSWSQIQFLTRMGSKVLGRFYKQESFYPISGFAKCFSWFVPHISLMWLFAVQDFHFWYLLGPPPIVHFQKRYLAKRKVDDSRECSLGLVISSQKQDYAQHFAIILNFDIRKETGRLYHG